VHFLQEGIYVEAAEKVKAFKAHRMEMTADEREAKETDMDEFVLKLKLRKLGNIRFVGELYKQGLITTKIMHKCIQHLMAEHDADEKCVAWKQCPDEQDLELLCKFLQTIGSTLEAKGQSLDSYFAQLEILSGVKALDSRIRFHLKDLVELRQNNWQDRRSVEGSKKTDSKDGAKQQQAAAQVGIACLCCLCGKLL
jgi:translation initiation factor 4G